MGLSTKQNSNLPKATKVFTDRQEPRDAFWNKYRIVKQTMGEDSDVNVLTYYGFGGIGKTSLLKQLIIEIKQMLPENQQYYVYHDFNTSTESRTVLESLKNALTTKYNFSFPLFELGLYIYANKIGQNANSPEVKQLIDKSPFLRFIVDTAGSIPIIGVASTVLDVADKGIALLRTYIKNHPQELTRIENMDAEDLYQYLPCLFSQDMRNNIKKLDAPLVIFLDTYERLVNEIDATGDPLQNDLWLRNLWGNRGVILDIPNTLWVIAGREKLKWDKLDIDWEGSIEQHILGDLSKFDSCNFLETAGVTDSKLREDLYLLTNGTPVYLDLCVEPYHRLIAQGVTPTASMFGKNTHELIERFLRYMSDSQKELIFIFACLQKWNDSLIFDIGKNILSSFNTITYSKAKELSFVITSNASEYSIHQTVGEVLFEYCPSMLKNQVSTHALNYYSELLQHISISNVLYMDALSQYIRLLTDFEQDYNTFYSHLRIILNQLNDFPTIGAHKLFLTHAQNLYNITRNSFPNSLADVFAKVYFANAMECNGKVKDAFNLLQSTSISLDELNISSNEQIILKGKIATVYTSAGYYFKAVPLVIDVLNTSRSIYSKEHPITINAMLEYSNILYNIGEYQEGESYTSSLVDICKANYKKSDIKTLKAMNILAYFYYKNNKAKKFCDIAKETYDISMQEYGTSYPETITYIHNYAISCNGEEQTKLHENAYLLRKELFGEAHPKTLDSKSHLASTLTPKEQIIRRKEIVHESISLLGEKHPDTLKYTFLLAKCLLTLNIHDEDALGLLNSVFIDYSKSLGEEHPNTLDVLKELAYVYVQTNQLPEAISQYHKLLTLQIKLLGPHYPSTLKTTYILNDLYDNIDNDKSYSLRLRQEILDFNILTYGATSDQAIHSMQALYLLYVHIKEYDKAISLRDDILSAQKAQKVTPQPPQTSLKELMDLMKKEHAFVTS